MSIKPPPPTEREIIEAGNYMARCVGMLHLGHIPNNYGAEVKIQDKVLVTWELPTLTYELEDKTEVSSVISKEYTLSLDSRGHLRKDLESWRGKAFTEKEAEDFDLTKLLGAPCMLNIIHKTAKSSGNTYAIVSSISKMPKGFTCPEQMRESLEFNYEDKFSLEVVDALPDFIKNKIKTSEEFTALTSGQQPDVQGTAAVETAPVENGEEPDDDLPF